MISRLPVGKIRVTVDGFLYATTIFGDAGMSLLRTSCSPDASWQSIWASQRRPAEGCFTAARGKNSSHSCWFYLCKDHEGES